MNRVFERKTEAGRESKASIHTTIFEQSEADAANCAPEVQVSMSACTRGIQPSFTIYVADPAELFAMSEQFKAAGVALEYALKFSAKAE